MKKRTKKHNPSFSFECKGTTMLFELLPDGIVMCTVFRKTGPCILNMREAFRDNALDVVANLRQAAAEIERMYFEQEG